VTGVVVVGIDGSEQSRRALAWAAEEAKLRGARLRVVHVWSYLAQTQAPFDPTYGDDDAQRLLQEVAGGLSDEVEVELVAVNDLPARGLLDSAGDADLLVVGARGLGGFRGLLLGSVSQEVVQRATCPVVVIPVRDVPPPT
jgi:nucleotide-binding universal stress UspA family protein